MARPHMADGPLRRSTSGGSTHCQLHLYVGVGCQRGMARAQLVDDDGRLIEADHIAAGRASKMALDPKSVGPASKAHKRKTPQEGPWRTTVGKSRGCNMPCVRTWPYQSRRNGSRVAGTGTDVGRRPRSLPPPAAGGAQLPSPCAPGAAGTRAGSGPDTTPERLAASRGAEGCERTTGWPSAGVIRFREDVHTTPSGNLALP